MDKIESSRVIKIGIVSEDADRTADELLELFSPVNPYDSEASDEIKAQYTAEDKYCRYKGEEVTDISLKVRIVYVEPVYFEIIEPLGDCRSPWHDFLKERGTGVCFISFYINGFRQHIDFMEQKNHALLFEEEKGYERYAYFDTLKSLGFLLEMKERVPKSEPLA